MKRVILLTALLIVALPLGVLAEAPPVATASSGVGATLVGSVGFVGTPGMGAPPATLGGHIMARFGNDARPVAQFVGSVPCPNPAWGSLIFNQVVTHAKVPAGGFDNWSHGYSGDVYHTAYSGNPQSLTIKLPPGTLAFYFYSETNNYTTANIVATEASGTASGLVSVTAPGGARYFGFYATGGAVLTSITVNVPSSGGGFGVGEFGISLGPVTPPLVLGTTFSDGVLRILGLDQPNPGWGVEVMVSPANGASPVPKVVAPESAIVAIGPDGRWSYQQSLAAGPYTVSVRTHTVAGNHSPWITFPIDTATLPTRLTALTQGYPPSGTPLGRDNYAGASDTYISLWSPNANFRETGLLKVRSGGVSKGLLRFDLGPLAAFACQGGEGPTEVSSASLVVYTQSRSNPHALDLHVYPLVTPWAGSQATWLLASATLMWVAPGAAATPDDHLSAPTAKATLALGQWVMLDVTDFVKGWLDGSMPNEGFLLAGTGRQSVEYNLASSSHPQPGFRPTLVVTGKP